VNRQIVAALLLAIAAPLATCAARHAGAATIDRMYTAPTGHLNQTYSPSVGTLFVIGKADYYELSDGSTWNSGAGVVNKQYLSLNSVSVDENTIRYTFNPSASGFVFKQVDYNNGNHASNGTLVETAPLVLEAELGSTHAKMSGYLNISDNTLPNAFINGFSYFSANRGEDVYFEVDYWLIGGTTWTPSLFASTFTYNLTGVVDFTRSIPEPSTYALASIGVVALLALKRRRR
jgi:hypothetical protein